MDFTDLIIFLLFQIYLSLQNKKGASTFRDEVPRVKPPETGKIHGAMLDQFLHGGCFFVFFSFGEIEWIKT